MSTVPVKLGVGNIKLTDTNALVLELECYVTTEDTKIFELVFKAHDYSVAPKFLADLLHGFGVKSLSKLKGVVCNAVLDKDENIVGFKQFPFEGSNEVLLSNYLI